MSAGFKSGGTVSKTRTLFLFRNRCNRRNRWMLQRLRPRILIQSKSQKDRRHDERGREEVRRRYSDRIERPTEEERRNDASDAAVRLLHSHVEAAVSGSN